MRVLIISDYRDTQAAKPEAEMMVRLKKRGVNLDIITFPNTAYQDTFKESGISVLDIHPTRKYDSSFIKKLQELTRKNNYQIFYLFNSQAIINGILAALRLPVKVVLYRGYTGNIHWYDPMAYFKYLNPRVDKIVCIAQSIKDYLHRQLFFPKRKAITINKGHDPSWYKNVETLDLSIFNIPKKAFVVACMGNARPFKGIKYLLQATHQLGNTPNLHLVLIGRDMNKGRLQKLLENSPMSDRIHVTGWRNDVLSILSACDVFILPSIGGEAITKSLIEAMSMGVAPIITNISGNKELVINEVNGLVVPSKSPLALTTAMEHLYNHPEEVKIYSVKAKEHIAKEFHIDRTVKEIMELFESLAGTVCHSSNSSRVTR